ncbi:hypothetical protein RND81_09G137100 [Saponaria officinalis]|uniref:Uncharacterized protein n=1 Tax=Saponaria officinalis TaxID=3572 RepID=A0AAW1IMD4_SAPOF
MDEKFRVEFESSCTDEEEDARADQEFYETIEAPKFVDFTRPNHFCPDDRFWFCSRVGCNQKHEEELDSEAIYKNFVLRVMAARSPNVRFQRALSRKPPSDIKKCPMSAPPKSSKSRIPRLALAASITKKLMEDGKDGTIRPAPVNPASKPKARVKHVPAKYMTSPRKKKGGSGSPKLADFRSVRNPKKTSIVMQKNKTVAKALLFSSPKKAVKAKASELAAATPVTRLCEGVKKLAITSEKKGVTEKASVRKLLPFDASKKPSSIAQKARTRKEHVAESSRCNKVKEKKRVKKIDDVTIEEKIDRISRNTDRSSSEKEPTSSTERSLTAGSSDGISSTTLTSELNSVPDSEDRCSEQQNFSAGEELNKMDQNKENESSTAEDDLENRVPGVVVELVDSDDKENAPNTYDIRNVNDNILSEHSTPAKSKVKTIQKIHNEEKKSTKENRPAAITQGVKYKKLKPTNPKPFRLRTDERGILKEATLERKVNSHENSTTASEKSQCTDNGVSATRENVEKKADDKTLKKVQFTLVKSKYKGKSKEVAPGSDRRPKYPALRKQPVLPQREIGSTVKPRRLDVTEKTTTTMSKPMGPRQCIAAKKAPVPKEANFHTLHKPKSCTRNIV